MKKKSNAKTWVIIIAIVGVLFIIFNNNNSGDEAGEQANNEEQSSQQAATGEESSSQDDNSAEAAGEESTDGQQMSGSAYSFVAQRGDSYSLMARKALQTLISEQELTVSKAGILYAETNLTKLAGSPLLNVGQGVQISKEAVSEWAKKAAQLSDSQVSAWDYYVQFANFDTSSVGVAS